MPHGSQRNAQKLRFRRFIIASSNYPVLIAVAALFDKLGYGSVSQQQLLLMSLLALVLVGFLASILVSNNNLKFNDPSLTGLQIAVSSLWGLGPFLILPEIRPLLLMLYFPSFTFGILRFNRRQYIQVFSFVVFLYLAALLLEYFYLRPQLEVAYELVLFSFFITVLGWFTYFGSLVSEIRSNLQRQNITDELTQQYNRRHAMQTMQYLHAYCSRYNERYSLAILDLDFFKNINDQYGHIVGDQVLSEFASMISEELRSVDIFLHPGNSKEQEPLMNDPVFARFGGEEFIIVLPGLSAEKARQCVDRLLLTVRQKKYAGDNEISLRFSAGIAGYTDQKSYQAILSEADAALYQAKSQGRNCVVVVEP